MTKLTKQQQKDEAYAACRAIVDPAYAACAAIVDPAYAACDAKIAEIITIKGKKYKLVEE